MAVTIVAIVVVGAVAGGSLWVLQSFKQNCLRVKVDKDCVYVTWRAQRR